MTDHMYIKPVDPLKLDGNLNENWKKFKRNYDIFVIAIGMGEKTDPVKINTFLNAVGPEAVEIYDTFDLTESNLQRYQKEGESFDAFLMDIKLLVKSCEFNQATNEMLRDRIVMGITDKKLQTKLLESNDLTYDAAVEKCRAAEATKEHTEKMSKIKSQEVNELKGDGAQSTQTYKQHSKNTRQSNNNKHRQNDKRATTWQGNTQYRSNASRNSGNSNSRGSNNNSENSRNNTNQSKCKRCGYNHNFNDKCPAQGKTCNVCSKPNHFGSVCKSRSINSIEYGFANDNNDFYIGALERNVTNTAGDVIATRWLERIRINDQLVAFKIDTGAEMNVLPLHIFRRLMFGSNEGLRFTNMTLRAFGGQTINPEVNFKFITIFILVVLLSTCHGGKKGKREKSSSKSPHYDAAAEQYYKKPGPIIHDGKKSSPKSDSSDSDSSDDNLFDWRLTQEQFEDKLGKLEAKNKTKITKKEKKASSKAPTYSSDSYSSENMLNDDIFDVDLTPEQIQDKLRVLKEEQKA
ncbi:myb-like protein F, partial [Sitodiplosis mosellana]|uniref:myb-like protein F n=1 Tax=Sitodiplosis mosellana TaxID=263140 RepID=UPI0024451AC3